MLKPWQTGDAPTTAPPTKNCGGALQTACENVHAISVCILNIP